MPPAFAGRVANVRNSIVEILNDRIAVFFIAPRMLTKLLQLHNTELVAAFSLHSHAGMHSATFALHTATRK
jgi:hypothetical protein